MSKNTRWDKIKTDSRNLTEQWFELQRKCVRAFACVRLRACVCVFACLWFNLLQFQTGGFFRFCGAIQISTPSFSQYRSLMNGQRESKQPRKRMERRRSATRKWTTWRIMDAIDVEIRVCIDSAGPTSSSRYWFTDWLIDWSIHWLTVSYHYWSNSLLLVDAV